MLKLYKHEESKILYWETWKYRSTFIMHWGEVGTFGETKRVYRPGIVKIEEDKMRNQGFEEIEELKYLIIQYKVDGFGNNEDLNIRYEIQYLLDETLGWTGLGHCDGGDIGSGSMNIACLVVDIELAVKVIVNALKEKKHDKGALIFTDSEADSAYLWPENYKGPYAP